jgi:hypothetical protein
MVIYQKTDDISIATIRTLAADIVFKSNSGHPGSCIWFPKRTIDTKCDICIRCPNGHGACCPHFVFAVRFDWNCKFERSTEIALSTQVFQRESEEFEVV